MKAVIRRATPQDVPEILQISAGIWDGDDYIPTVLNGWMADPTGELVVADVGGRVAAFAKMTLLTPHDGWLEGLRGSPEFKGLGCAQQITAHFIARAHAMGLRSLRLSTYQHNYESRHIIEKYGFREIARFVAMGRDVGPNVQCGAGRVSPDETRAVWTLISDGEWLRKAHGFYADAWTFIPVDQAVLGRLIDEGKVWRLPSGALAAYLPDPHSSADYEFAMLYGRPDDIEGLVQHGQWLAAAAGRKYVYSHCPDDSDLLAAFFACGCSHFDMTPPEVGYTLVLEYDMSQQA